MAKKRARSKTPRRKSQRKRNRSAKGEYYDQYLAECDLPPAPEHASVSVAVEEGSISKKSPPAPEQGRLSEAVEEGKSGVVASPPAPGHTSDAVEKGEVAVDESPPAPSPVSVSVAVEKGVSGESPPAPEQRQDSEAVEQSEKNVDMEIAVDKSTPADDSLPAPEPVSVSVAVEKGVSGKSPPVPERRQDSEAVEQSEQHVDMEIAVDKSTPADDSPPAPEPVSVSVAVEKDISGKLPPVPEQEQDSEAVEQGEPNGDVEIAVDKSTPADDSPPAPEPVPVSVAVEKGISGKLPPVPERELADEAVEKGENSVVGATEHDMLPMRDQPVCSYTNYSLNEKAAYIKKLNACRRENFTIERKNSSDTITFNTTAFEIFRRCFDSYYQYHNDKFLLQRTPVVDKNRNIVVQDTVRVTDPNKPDTPLIYTVNIYRTTSRTMVNGSHYTRFVDDDLPYITNMINQEADNIKECNEILQKQLSSHIFRQRAAHDVAANSKLLEHQSDTLETIELGKGEEQNLSVTSSTCKLGTTDEEPILIATQNSLSGNDQHSIVGTSPEAPQEVSDANSPPADTLGIIEERSTSNKPADSPSVELDIGHHDSDSELFSSFSGHEVEEDDEFSVVEVSVEEPKQELSINKTMELYSKTLMDECSHCMSLEKSHAEIMRELHEKNENIIEILEEQQMAIKRANDLTLQNENLNVVIMNTAARMRELIDENQSKDKILKKLEQNQMEVKDVYEKEIHLLKIQVENHEEKEESMNENLIYYMDENVRLKNRLRVEGVRSLEADQEKKNEIDFSMELRKLRDEFLRFKKFASNNFITKIDSGQPSVTKLTQEQSQPKQLSQEQPHQQQQQQEQQPEQEKPPQEEPPQENQPLQEQHPQKNQLPQEQQHTQEKQHQFVQHQQEQRLQQKPQPLPKPSQQRKPRPVPRPRPVQQLESKQEPQQFQQFQQQHREQIQMPTVQLRRQEITSGLLVKIMNHP